MELGFRQLLAADVAVERGLIPAAEAVAALADDAGVIGRMAGPERARLEEEVERCWPTRTATRGWR